MIQGSEEWLQARVGKVTASRVHDIIATIKSGGPSASRKTYMGELIAERLTGAAAPTYQSAAMAYGSECEADARFAYAIHTGFEVEEVGFVPHPTIVQAGCSPDGLVGKNGLVEIKCPNTATHVDTVLGGKVPIEYITQCQFQMACTGRQWVDWVSYDKRLPEHLRMDLRRIVRDDDVIERLNAAVRTFLAELDATVEKLNQRRPAPAVAV